MEENNPRFFTSPGDNQIDLIGNPIDITGIIDATISPDRMVHVVVGTASGSIATINPPWPDFVGPLYLIGSGTPVTYNLGGNIATSGNFLVAALIFNRKSAQWFIVAT